MGLALASIRSPRRAGLRWLMESCTPATLLYPDAMNPPMLAADSAMSADTPPLSILNGCNHADGTN
jgi:hypothetical protein